MMVSCGKDGSEKRVVLKSKVILWEEPSLICAPKWEEFAMKARQTAREGGTRVLITNAIC